MQTLLKFPAFILLILVGCTAVHAQTNLKKPDVIQKMDKTSLEVIVDEINKTEILYRKPNDPKGPLHAIPKAEVNKIIWNNGRTEEINAVPVVSQKSAKPTDLLVRKKPELTFKDKKGLFAGLRAGAGVGMVNSPGGTVLASGAKLAYNAGGILGYRFKAVNIQLEALYSGISFEMNLPENMTTIKSVEGRQNNLVVPLTATIFKNLGKTRLGVTIGGYGSWQVGPGSTKVNYSEKPATNTKNCRTCGDKMAYGLVGGLTAILVDKPAYSIFMDGRWYHSLVDNSEYKNIAESGVKMNTGILSAGVLFNLSHD